MEADQRVSAFARQGMAVPEVFNTHTPAPAVADSGDCRAAFRPPFNDLAVGELVEVILSPRDSFAVVAALASGGDPVGDEIIFGRRCGRL